MKKVLFLFASFFIGLGLFVWIIDFVGWQEIKNTFSVFYGWQGIIILFLTFLTMVIGNLKWKEILKGENVKVSFWKLFSPFLAGFSVMFLAPTLLGLGEIFRTYELKRKNEISWPKATASVIIDRIFEWTINLIIIFIGVLIFFFKAGFPSDGLVIVFGGAFLFFFFIVLVFYFKIIKRESIVKTFGRFFTKSIDKEPLDTEKEIFNFFRLQNKPMWKSLGFSFLRAGVMYLRTWILIGFLGKKISAIFSLSILSFTYLASIIPIPTSLGSHEAIQIFAFKSFGLDSSSATAFTMIIRAAELLFALVGVGLLTKMGMVFFKDVFSKGIKKLNEFKNNL